ncbi:hypothetical protein K7A41_01980 [Sphingobacterium sp. InxBP1]|uniref:hypothetical protein n=1 Tax=Sphingobacterium sp. InxBP1 TaxID=2870328 RepID=UPI002244E166|nr:hypothetical protein [Sphingobacterium sp. InxBP1]MCW8309984.1 hypothetical protein [Sphingobacterium sp. InxBP1]
MKRLLFAALIGTATLVSFSSCKKEYITNYLPGVSYTFDIPNDSFGDWKRISGTNTFVIEVPFPELDRQYFETGHVNVAISFNNDRPDYFRNIPSAIGAYDYRVDYKIGQVIVYADYVGIGTPAVPGEMIMKVTLTDADNGGQ